MDFSACVISKGLGSAPVKLGDSSFSAALQIKQGCLSKQNPLRRYFPPSVWPDQIQGSHFNPEVSWDQETLGSVKLTKGSIKTLSGPFLNLSTSSMGVSEKLPLSLCLTQQASKAQHTLSSLNNVPEPKTLAFSFSYTCLLFLSTVWHFTTINSVLHSHIGSRPSKTLSRYAQWGVFTCCQGLHECSSCCLFGCLQQQCLSSVW